MDTVLFGAIPRFQARFLDFYSTVKYKTLKLYLKCKVYWITG